MENEAWADVLGYEGVYQVSTLGRVRRVGGSARARATRVLKDCDNGNGYRYIKLCSNGVPRNHYVHILMAQAFLPNPENKPQVNHIDGVKSANRIDNLEWATLSENMLHAADMGLTKVKGEENSMSRYTCVEILEIRRLFAEGHNQRAIGRRFGMSFANVNRVIHRRLWQHV